MITRPLPRPSILSSIFSMRSRRSSSKTEESVEEDDRKRAGFQGDTISSRRKKSRGSNSGNGGNTGDEGKMSGGVIGAYGSGIDKSSERSEEVFPGEAGEARKSKRLSLAFLSMYNDYGKLGSSLERCKMVGREQAKQELFEIVKAFHACKQEDGQSVSSYLLKMKSYLDTLECLGYAMPKELGHEEDTSAMLKLYEKGIPKKAETPAVLAIQEGKIQKDKKKLQRAKGKDKGKNKLSYAPKTKIPLSPKRDNPAKDSICHHCKEVGHWRRNCPSYHGELKKRKNASEASTSGIITIELYAFPNNTWVYDMGCGTHICNTSQGLRKSKKLKHGALSLYMGNGMRTAVEAIGSFDLILPTGLIIVLDNCLFVPIVTRGVVSISCLVKNGYIHTFTNYGIFVSKDNVFYFNVILRDGSYEIDMHNIYPNVSSSYNVSNKKAKHGLDSYYLWHCRLGHINKKRMDMLQRDGLLQPTHDESHEKFKSCISEKMARKHFPLWKELRIC
ncbi:zinc finger, CCHC-type containing protein [Tanacetum coccineum]